jgi:hypothetical protein
MTTTAEAATPDDAPGTDLRLDKIRALTDRQKHMMLVYLDGYAPKAIDAAFAAEAIALPRRTARPALTDQDRRIIDAARELAEYRSTNTLGLYIREMDDDLVYPVAFGSAAVLLGQLADIITRVAGE